MVKVGKLSLGIGGISAITILVIGGIAFFIFQDDLTEFVFGFEERINIITDIEGEIGVDLPDISDDPTETSDPFESVTPPPEELQISQENLVAIFLENLGIVDIETFGVDVQVELFDANLESVIETSFLRVQPLDPREVIVGTADELDPERFFINTDFSTQINDAGTKHHKFSGWDVVNDPSRCKTTGSPPISFDCPIPISTTTTQDCEGLREDAKTCVNIIGFKNKDDDVGNGSRFHGIARNVDISDWTREGNLVVEVDYTCPPFQRNSQYYLLVVGDTSGRWDLPCREGQTFKTNVETVTGNANSLLVGISAQARNVDNFVVNLKISDAKVIGNSVAKREAIEVLEQLSIVQNDQEQRILDLGFIETKLTGQTFFDNEPTTVNGVLETRIDGKTISTHQVTGSGITQNNNLPLRIDGEESFVFKLQDQFFDEGTFHTFTIILNDFIVNVGMGSELRTFEYHTPFPAYTLEFRVFEDEITAFGQDSRAITVPISDTTFTICGLTESSVEDEVLPPVVNIRHNGFTIETTNPRAGLVMQLGENEEFCSVVPDLPRNTILTFEIQDNFYDVNVPSTTTNYFLKCDRSGCNSNVGFSE